MKTVIIPQREIGLEEIHVVARATHDREIEFPEGHWYAVVSTDTDEYTTHSTESDAIQAHRESNSWIVGDDGYYYNAEHDYLGKSWLIKDTHRRSFRVRTGHHGNQNAKKPETKTLFNVRLANADIDLIKKVSEYLGCTQTQIVASAIKKYTEMDHLKHLR